MTLQGIEVQEKGCRRDLSEIDSNYTHKSEDRNFFIVEITLY